MQASPSSSRSHISAAAGLRPLSVETVKAGTRSRDPLARVNALGMEKHVTIATWALLLALFFHGTAAARVALINSELIAWSHGLRQAINDRLALTYDIDVEKPKPPPEPPKEEKEPPKEEKAPPPAPKSAPPPPPPAAAQAGAVLTQKPDDSPVDFTNSFVTGNADTYAGGVTQATGTSKVAVRDLNAQPGGVPGGTGTKPAPPGPPALDRSRGLSVSNTQWNCEFPPEADSEQIDQMRVLVEVTVSASGRVTNARALKDPGYGFARAAVQCALRQGASTFDVALDRDGNPIAATKSFNVHFDR
jgi:protein TonB